MRVAIMQPYLFPYLGYFQLLHHADMLVLLDDVAYINRGWINRNRLLVNQAVYHFTVPLAGRSQNRRIGDLRLHPDLRSRRKLLATIAQAYAGSAQAPQVLPLLAELLLADAPDLTALVQASLERLTAYAGTHPVSILRSSAIAKDPAATGPARILALCQALGAHTYVNPLGGAALYDAATFAGHGIRLLLAEPVLPAYPQRSPVFVPGLSVIDVLLQTTPTQAGQLMQQGRLHEAASPLPFT